MTDRATPTPSGDGPAVEILLATYNSGRYFQEQIDSLAGQSFDDFRVLIRDDGSTDGTAEGVARLAAERPERFVHLQDGQRRGACGSFAALLDAATAPRVMFCDHDDVWRREKIARTLAALEAKEAATGSRSAPVVAFTDLRIVDERLQTLCPSYWQRQNIDPRRLALRQLLSQNVASGCTMMLNRPMVELCRPIAPEAVMHDHWVSLVAAAMGHFAYLPEATLLYRQHARNVFGAGGGGWHDLAARFGQGISAVRERYYKNVRQAKAFLDRYRNRLAPADRGLLEAFSSLDEQGPLQRRATLLRHGIFKNGLARNLATLAIV